MPAGVSPDSEWPDETVHHPPSEAWRNWGSCSKSPRGGLKSASGNLFQQEQGSLRQVAFSLKPILHRGSQGFERDTRTDLHQSVAEREGVVECGIIREIAHGKAVEPLQRARLAPTIIFVGNCDSA